MKLFRIALTAALLGISGCNWDSPPSKNNIVSAENVVPDQPVHNAFPGASEVRLFVETGYRGDQPVFSKPAGLTLNSEQRAKLESLLAIHTISPDEMFAMCFIPHHFFRYFDRQGKLIGEVDVCFCCAGVEASGASNTRLQKGQMLEADYKGLKAFVASLGERTDVQCDHAA